MGASKLILAALKLKNIPTQTIHSRKNALRKKVNIAISSEVAIDIVASNEGIDVHKLLKKDRRIKKLRSDLNQQKSRIDKLEKRITTLQKSKKTVGL